MRVMIVGGNQMKYFASRLINHAEDRAGETGKNIKASIMQIFLKKRTVSSA